MSDPLLRPSSDSDNSLSAALEFAKRVLGPASGAHVQTPEAARLVTQRLDAGADLHDAVLGAMHAAISRDRKVADEFAAYFMLDMMRNGSGSLPNSSGLRRFLDTEDLVDSVFGDMWGDLAGLEFRTRSQFLSLLIRRMDWKATDKARRIHARSRSEDKRVPMPDEKELSASDDEDGHPLGLTIKKEEQERLILILLRLKERDRKLLSMHLKGASIETIADTLDLSYEAARKALSRAIDQARRVAGS